MATISIKRSYDWTVELPVTINGECNHAGAEEHIMGGRKALVCKCGQVDFGVIEYNEDGKHTVYMGYWQ